MTELLQSILSDPELRAWPRLTTNVSASLNAEAGSDSDLDTQAISAPPHSSAVEDHQAAADRMRESIADSPELDTDDPHSDTVSGPKAAPPVDTENDEPRDRTADDPDAERADAPRPDSDERPSPPMAFDDIAAKPNAITTRIIAAGQWLRNREWKNPKTIGMTAAAAVTVAALGMWWADSTDHHGSTAQIARSDEAPTTTSLSGPQVSQDTPVPVVTATAHCPAPSSDPMNAIRTSNGQFWKCVRAWQMDGQLLELTFDKAYVITAVSVMPGANTEVDGEDQWAKYRTVTRLSWKFNDAGHTTCTQATDNTRKLATLTVTAANCHHTGPWQPVVASAATITIEKTSAPSNPSSVATPGGEAGSGDYTAFAVSHLELVGHPAG